MLKCMKPHAHPHPYLPAPGFGLVELLLALGVATAMGAAAFLIYPRVSTRVNVASDVENVRAMASRIDYSYGIVGSFRGVSTSIVIEDNLAPTDFRQGTSSALSNAWGGSVSVSPATVRLAGDAFSVGLSGLPSRACVPFVSAIAGDVDVRDVIVENTSVLLGNRGTLDVAVLGSACGSDGAFIEIVYYSGMVSGSSVAVLPTLPTPSTPAQPAPSMSTPAGLVPNAPDVSDAVKGTPGSAPPGSGAAPMPAVPQVPPPSAPPSLVPCRQSESSMARASCPAGTWGTETVRTRQACPSSDADPNSDTAWEHPEAWAKPVTVVAITARDCQACPGPAREEQDQWLPTSQACPAGQTGPHTWERQQVRSRDVFTHCPYGSTALPGSTYGGWSAWADTGARRNEVNTCKPSAPRCSDGSLQVAAWFSADVDDLPPLSGSSGVSYCYDDAVVRLTPADKARLEWAIHNVPIHRVETPAPIPGNWPANVSESAFYEEQCNALSDVGNIRYAYSYDFECVSNMGMHYCDYNWTSGGTSMAVCRQACASDLVGKTNNPYRWEWPESSVVSATPYVTCTGQPGCTPNGGYGTQQGLPACNEQNVGQSMGFSWYRQFYNPSRVDYQVLTLTCKGPMP
ncbi:type 4 pilus major pilin [Xanthomonas cerealis]|uniref:type 4 pilus major pilin n=2 Tax=Xanthomonas cerealis TaxID=3390025 RepID=UPI0009B88131|nr:type 4 pilus major pilin [Xanthomonas translucens]